MRNRKWRIIIDTNLWISFLITNNYEKLDSLIDNKKIRLLFSKELIEEFIVVTGRPKFQKFFLKSDIEKTLLVFETIGELVEIKSNVMDCRDLKDNFLLNLAIDGKADFLISGDKDLLILKNIGAAKIVTMANFLELL